MLLLFIGYLLYYYVVAGNIVVVIIIFATIQQLLMQTNGMNIKHFQWQALTTTTNTTSKV